MACVGLHKLRSCSGRDRERDYRPTRRTDSYSSDRLPYMVSNAGLDEAVAYVEFSTGK